LVVKSLVAVIMGDGEVRYRLLETIHAYARRKLDMSGDGGQVAARHAEFFRDTLGKAEAEWETRPTADWLATYGPEVDNIRAALDWSFSPGGSRAIGADLAVASVPLWFQLTLMEECRARVEQALMGIENDSSHAQRRNMKLFAGLGASLIPTQGPVPENAAAWRSALDIANRIGDTDYQLRALWGLCAYHVTLGEYRTALEFARRFRGLAEDIADPVSQSIGDRIIGYTLHFMGEQASARQHIASMLDRFAMLPSRSYAIRYQIDPTSTARSLLARILWLQGFPDRAVRTAEASVAEARLRAHAITLCQVLAEQCAVELDVGNCPAAERCIALLLEESARHSLTLCNAWGRCFRGTLLIVHGDCDVGLHLLQTALDELRGKGFGLRYASFAGLLAKGHGAGGSPIEGLATIDEALALSERTEERWHVAELLRVKGELLVADNEANASVAEEHFRRSIDCARQQGALSLELRAATSFARLLRAQGRTHDGRDLLNSVYVRFTEGFDTADLQIARRLLEGWS